MKNCENIAVIETLSHEGRGIARINGKATFIVGALPNETVRFNYTKQRNKFDEGLIVEVIANPNPARQTPPCQHFLTCGGCSLQHLNSQQQILNKQQTVLELLAQANIVPKHLLPPICGRTTGYRYKARLGVKYVAKKNKVLVGFRERQGNFLANLNSCAVLHPSVGLNIHLLSELIYALKTRTQVPQLEIAVGDDETAIVVRHLVPLPDQDKTLLIHFAKQHNLKIYLQPKSIKTIELLYPANANPLLNYRLGNIMFDFHPAQFTQVNNEINQKMVKRAIELLELTAQDNVLDLFCGIGNFSLPIAQHVQQVTGIEGSDSAVNQAKTNATKNHIDNVAFYTANLNTNEFNTAWANQPYHKILLDPPRSGALALMPWLINQSPSHIVYVSCNPITMVRDATVLTHHGYQLIRLGMIDMFPHTQHIETIGLYQK